MELTITIHPAKSDDGLLSVEDAMQQVADIIKLHEEALHALSSPGDAFEWQLLRASTNSPFTIVALAVGTGAEGDPAPLVRRVTSAVSSGLRDVMVHGEAPAWMGNSALTLTRSLLARNQNGIGSTEFGTDEANVVAIDRSAADSGMRALRAISGTIAESELSERESWGEIVGRMVMVGRHYQRSAIAIHNEQYGLVWCYVADALRERFGSEHRMDEVWKGKLIGVEGTLVYGTGGKLKRIDATDIREMSDTPPINLDSVVDPDFMGGLDPTEYLRQLYEGELAF
jgi:hypothetical protein